MFDNFDDTGAIRCAVADILITISSGRCNEDQIRMARKFLESAVGALLNEEMEKQDR